MKNPLQIICYLILLAVAGSLAAEITFIKGSEFSSDASLTDLIEAYDKSNTYYKESNRSKIIQFQVFVQGIHTKEEYQVPTALEYKLYENVQIIGLDASTMTIRQDAYPETVQLTMDYSPVPADWGSSTRPTEENLQYYTVNIHTFLNRVYFIEFTNYDKWELEIALNGLIGGNLAFKDKSYSVSITKKIGVDTKSIEWQHNRDGGSWQDVTLVGTLPKIAFDQTGTYQFRGKVITGGNERISNEITVEVIEQPTVTTGTFNRSPKVLETIELPVTAPKGTYYDIAWQPQSRIETYIKKTGDNTAVCLQTSNSVKVSVTVTPYTMHKGERVNGTPVTESVEIQDDPFTIEVLDSKSSSVTMKITREIELNADKNERVYIKINGNDYTGNYFQNSQSIEVTYTFKKGDPRNHVDLVFYRTDNNERSGTTGEEERGNEIARWEKRIKIDGYDEKIIIELAVSGTKNTDDGFVLTVNSEGVRDIRYEYTKLNYNQWEALAIDAGFWGKIETTGTYEIRAIGTGTSGNDVESNTITVNVKEKTVPDVTEDGTRKNQPTGDGYSITGVTFSVIRDHINVNYNILHGNTQLRNQSDYTGLTGTYIIGNTNNENGFEPSKPISLRVDDLSKGQSMTLKLFQSGGQQPVATITFTIPDNEYQQARNNAIEALLEKIVISEIQGEWTDTKKLEFSGKVVATSEYSDKIDTVLARLSGFGGLEIQVNGGMGEIGRIAADENDPTSFGGAITIEQSVPETVYFAILAVGDVSVSGGNAQKEVTIETLANTVEVSLEKPVYSIKGNDRYNLEISFSLIFYGQSNYVKEKFYEFTETPTNMRFFVKRGTEDQSIAGGDSGIPVKDEKDGSYTNGSVDVHHGISLTNGDEVYIELLFGDFGNVKSEKRTLEFKKGPPNPWIRQSK